MTNPGRLHDQPDPNNDLLEPVEDPLDEEEEYGRIGYGKFGERTPYWLAAGIILTILVVALANWVDNGNDEPDSRTAPEFSLILPSGDTFKLEDQRGKVVIVNFWATWCEPCKEEMPELQKLAESDPNVVVIGIAAPYDDPEKIQEFLTTYGITYTTGIDTGDSGPIGDIANEFNIIGYPATFIIDGEGTISRTIFGAVPLEELQGYVDQAKP